MGISVSVAAQAVQALVPVPVATQVGAVITDHAPQSWMQAEVSLPLQAMPANTTKTKRIQNAVLLIM
jgi:hypothetical protein